MCGPFAESIVTRKWSHTSASDSIFAIDCSLNRTFSGKVRSVPVFVYVCCPPFAYAVMGSGSRETSVIRSRLHMVLMVDPESIRIQF